MISFGEIHLKIDDIDKEISRNFEWTTERAEAQMMLNEAHLILYKAEKYLGYCTKK
jgi:hypothetical protein